MAKLQDVLSQMPKEEAQYHMQRCIDSGLWVPDAKAAGERGRICVCCVLCTYTLYFEDSACPAELPW